MQPAPQIAPTLDPDKIVAELLEGKLTTKSEILNYFVGQVRSLLEDGAKAQSEYNTVLQRKTELEEKATGIRASLRKYRDDIKNHLDQLEK